MKDTKLIIVEGIPGSGKTTAAQFIKASLDKAGVKNKLFNEGDLNHPADFESVACFRVGEYKGLLERYRNYAALLDNNIEVKEDNYYLYYRKLKNEKDNEIPEELFNELSKYDICDGLSLERYEELTLKRWSDFAEKASRGDIVYIFECCFIQNPAVIMLARHYTNKGEIIKHILRIENIIKKLNPKLIYFYQDSVRETIAKVALERDKGWINFVTEYVCSQTYGKAVGLKGFDGVVKFFEDRRAIELEALEKLNINKILLNNSERNWANRYREIDLFLALK